ncbi:carboxylesterase family protein [Streptomyces echinatus]|uniref:Carboxylesterase type B n=1 Tax=Streptomyces echinatus TaxID=67293 RepID=A0A7W9USU8_9ACTN|nr:carboxylesterase family protein [Streptomyces echinatus]MBB5929913.1 carboxylesterase type B [Streptomyces echinatus]
MSCTSDEFRLFTVPSGLSGPVTDELVERTAAAYGLPPGSGVTAYRAAVPGASPGEVFADIATDWFYRLPALRLAEAQARHGARAFVYEFAWPSPAYDGALGACHALDVPFVFDNLADPAFALLLGDSPPQAIAETMHAAWVSFATTGDPGWAAYGEPDRSVMRFATSPTTHRDPRGELRALWADPR